MVPASAHDFTPEVRKRKGAKVRVEAECEAEIVGFTILSRVEPHFGTIQDWNGENGGSAASERIGRATHFAWVSP